MFEVSSGMFQMVLRSFHVLRVFEDPWVQVVFRCLYRFLKVFFKGFLRGQ